MFRRPLLDNAHCPASPIKSPASPSKRLRPAQLLAYLHTCSQSRHVFILSPKQCGLLIEALQRVVSWICQWEKVSLSASLVRDLLTLATKGVRLLESCQPANPSSWLPITSFKLESREEFFQLFQGFLLALQGFVEVMPGPPPLQNTEDCPSPLTWASPTGPHKRCVDEARSLIASLNHHLCLLQLKSAEDRRAIYEKLERGSFLEGEEIKICQFVMERLHGKHKNGAALRLESQAIGIGRCIGGGEYGTVYEAKWMGMHVAVKQFRYQASLDAELNALLKTNHINIILVMGFVPEEGSSNPYLVMERMKGDLSQFVQRVQVAKLELPLVVSVEILLQVAAGMAHLHAQNIVHRDLKPENILFDRWPPKSTGAMHQDPGDFTVKITDFGESRIHTNHTTEATSKRGTACYRAPEVLREINEKGRSRYSNKVDVYSFGMVCYKVLTGSDPCLSKEKARQGDTGELTFPSNTPLAFIYFMRRCWTRAHQQRPSFLEICDFLALVKSVLLNTRPMNDHMPPLYLGIRSDMLDKLVAFLGNEWLMEEAIALGIRLEFRQSLNRLEINEVWLHSEVTKKLAALPKGKFLRWACCCGRRQPILIN